MTTPTGILFEEPINQPLDTNGKVQAGCYYCFFATGTTTPANVYANGTLATPLSQPTPGQVNPVAGTVANSAGQFVAIYLDPTVIYRRQLYSATGTLLSDVDPIVPQNVSLGVAQTWTAAQVITTSSGVPLTLNPPSTTNGLIINGGVNAYGEIIIGSSTSSDSYGLLIQAGTNSTDAALRVQTQSGTDIFKCRGDGAIQGYGTTAAGFVDMTPDEGTFTGSLTGMTTTPTVTCKWVRMGNLVILGITGNAGSQGTSNATTFTMTGLPAEIQPPTLSQWAAISSINMFEDNGSATPGQVEIGALNSTVTFYKNNSSTGWTSSGTKGVENNLTFICVYALI